MNELRLEWQTGSQRQSHTMIAGSSVLIGRQPDCTIVLADPAVSRRHASIYSEDGHFYLRNLSQINNLPVNNQFRLASAQSVALHQGDTFRIGPVMLHVVAITPTEVHPPRIKCVTCGNILDYQPETFCSYCGTALAEGNTVSSLPDVPTFAR